MKTSSLILFAALFGAHGTASTAREVESTRDGSLSAGQWPRSRESDTTDLFRVMGKNATWKAVGSVPMSWATFHTQSLIKIGNAFYVSAVEVLESTVRNGVDTDALYDFSIDRSTGAGRGWLFKFDVTGRLLGKVELTDGTMFHPGGMDYDGRYLWVPVAEYRPNSHSHIYRVNPKTLTAELVFTARGSHRRGRAQRASWHVARRELGLAAPVHVGALTRRAQRQGLADELGAEPGGLHRLSGLPLSGRGIHALWRSQQVRHVRLAAWRSGASSWWICEPTGPSTRFR